MRVPWCKSKSLQLDLLSPDPAADEDFNLKALVVDSEPAHGGARTLSTGQPLIVPMASLFEDPNNPRTEFPEIELEELAGDIRQHGILQPIVVHPVDTLGRHQIHFGVKRWRAARLAELLEVPVVVRDAPADPYTQVAENQKRHGLTPLDLARFIRGRIDAGESNSDVARRLGMNLTTVAHHLSLLDLPPALDDALKSGRCTSPRTLHELSKLHQQRPKQVEALVDRRGDITREAVATLREAEGFCAASSSTKRVAQAVAACERLQKLLASIDPQAFEAGSADLAGLRAKVAALSTWSPPCSDGQTP